MMNTLDIKKHSLRLANNKEMNELYSLRHDVYADELGQYERSVNGILRDSPGIESKYIVYRNSMNLKGFVGVTPPHKLFSLERYFSRNEISEEHRANTYEIRALTVRKENRNSKAAMYLMYAAYRLVESQGGKGILAMARKEVLPMYQDLGMKSLNCSFRCGGVDYEIVFGSIEEMRASAKKISRHLTKDFSLDWQLDIDIESPAPCYHGGDFFKAIGETFDSLDRRHEIINADVLDAWFPPAPACVEMITHHSEWLMRTSPPLFSEGLIEQIAISRNIKPGSILTGGGSSDLIYLAFLRLLDENSRVLLLDPSYGEYHHILKNVIKCRVEYFKLERKNSYRLDIDQLIDRLSEGFDLFVWVNPNSPTGSFCFPEEVKNVINSSSKCKKIWLDETYVDFVDKKFSMESLAQNSEKLIVCKSMSKVYALSGMRAAYICSSYQNLEKLRPLSPPWSVGLAAQVAAVYALKSEKYYKSKYIETESLRNALTLALNKLGITEVIPACANFLMFHLPEKLGSANRFIARCRKKGLYLRSLQGMSEKTDDDIIRIAVKDEVTQTKMLAIIEQVMMSDLRE